MLIDKEACIGCKECLEACPFGAMQYDDDKETAVKCDLCVDRLNNGQAGTTRSRHHERAFRLLQGVGHGGGQ